MSEGLGSDVLPMPYHMAATPTPRRIGPPSARLVVRRGRRAHRRPAAAQRLEAGGQAGARGQLLGCRGQRADPQRVAQAELERIDAELAGEVVHQRLVGDRRLGHAEAAERARRRAVGVDRAAGAQDRADRVRTHRMDRDAVGDGRAPRGVGAGVEVGVDGGGGEASVGVGAERRRDRAPGGASWSRPSTPAAGRGREPGGRGGAPRSRSAAGATGRACRRSRRRRRSG